MVGCNVAYRRRVRHGDGECGRNETGSAARGLAAQQPVDGGRYQPSAVRLRHNHRHVASVPTQQKSYVCCRAFKPRLHQIHVDGDRRYKWIQVDTTCIRATCIRCKLSDFESVGKVLLNRLVCSSTTYRAYTVVSDCDISERDVE